LDSLGEPPRRAEGRRGAGAGRRGTAAKATEPARVRGLLPRAEALEMTIETQQMVSKPAAVLSGGEIMTEESQRSQ